MTKSKVAKLMDAYLAEVARDANLPLPRFQNLAESLPQFSRPTDDGLYRAVDTYLKACPTPFLLKMQTDPMGDHVFVVRCKVHHGLHVEPWPDVAPIQEEII